MRSAAIGFAVVLVAGLVAVVAVALGRETSVVYSLGVNPALAAAALPPDGRICQRPVRPPRGVEFDRVGFLLDTAGKRGPALAVEVRASGTNRRLATGHLAAGYVDALSTRQPEHVVPVGRVDTGAPLSLCLVNEGNRPVSVIGQSGVASPVTSATLNGKPLDTDVTFDLHDGGKSFLARLPDIAERASRFRAGWVTPGVYLVLAIAILIGAPLLLARGLARAAADDQRSAASTTRQ
jgi:hypothetical protein